MSNVVNPDMKKEVGGGMIMAALTWIGFIFVFVAIVVPSLPIRILLWLVGMAMMGYSLYLSVKSVHGGAFRIVNIVMKIVLLVIGLLMLFLIFAGIY